MIKGFPNKLFPCDCMPAYILNAPERQQQLLYCFVKQLTRTHILYPALINGFKLHVGVRKILVD